MKHLKIVGLFVMAAASLMAIAGSASAAGTFTSPTGTAYKGAFGASLEGSTLLKAGFAEITCTTGTLAVTIERNNEEHVSGPFTSVSFSTCTSPQGTPTVTTLSSTGTLTIRKGTHAIIGTSCVYGMASGTSLGTANNTTGGAGGADRVTLAISANLTKVSGGFLCASPAAWTASYVVTAPSPSFVD